MKKVLIIGFVVVAIALVVILGGQRIAGAQASPTSQPTLPPVKSSSSIIAQGDVVPTQDTTLSFATSGVVSEVLVKEGQTVQAGQVLARLSGAEQLQAALTEAEQAVLSAQQDLNTLKENAATASVQAQLSVVQAQKALDDAQKHRRALDYRASADQIAAANANYILANNAVDKVQDTYNSMDSRAEDDPARAMALANLENAKKARDKAQINLNWYKGKADPKEIAEADINVGLAQSKLNDTQTQLNKVKSGPNAEKTALLDAQLKTAQSKVDAARASLTNLELKAPFGGVVSSVEMSAGEYMAPGTAVAKLANSSAWLVKTTDLTELNVAKITPGMTATIKLDALPDVQMNGVVEYIETFGTNHQSDIVYTVVLKIDKPDPRLRWNMTAVVTFPEK